MSYNTQIVEYIISTLHDKFENEPLMSSFVNILEQNVRARQSNEQRRMLDRQLLSIRTQRMDPMYSLPGQSQVNTPTQPDLEGVFTSIDRMINRIEEMIDNTENRQIDRIVDEVPTIVRNPHYNGRRTRRNAIYNRNSYDSLSSLIDVKVSLKLEDLNKNSKIVYNNNVNDNCKCNICMDDNEEDKIYRELKCKHRFHQVCIDKWFEGSKTCPICRQTMEN
jgi:hypothetical protein